jgi:predicted small integral membrane protein
MGYKLACSALAVVLTFVAFVPYIRSILADRTKPHVFSWVIWGITTMIVFFAQLEVKSGMGAWPNIRPTMDRYLANLTLLTTPIQLIRMESIDTQIIILTIGSDRPTASPQLSQWSFGAFPLRHQIRPILARIENHGHIFELPFVCHRL